MPFTGIPTSLSKPAWVAIFCRCNLLVQWLSYWVHACLLHNKQYTLPSGITFRTNFSKAAVSFEPCASAMDS